MRAFRTEPKSLFPESVRRIVALLLLLFAATDLTIADVLSPEHCAGERIGSHHGSLASASDDFRPTGDGAVNAIAPRDESSDESHHDGGCCVWCCAHVLPADIFFSVAPNETSPVHELPTLPQLLSLPAAIYHPPV